MIIVRNLCRKGYLLITLHLTLSFAKDSSIVTVTTARYSSRMTVNQPRLISNTSHTTQNHWTISFTKVCIRI